ncbi:hypothetical protein FS749_005147, partial [Ceratobasidium sp. UAMH 11750]
TGTQMPTGGEVDNQGHGAALLYNVVRPRSATAASLHRSRPRSVDRHKARRSRRPATSRSCVDALDSTAPFTESCTARPQRPVPPRPTHRRESGSSHSTTPPGLALHQARSRCVLLGRLGDDSSVVPRVSFPCPSSPARADLSVTSTPRPPQ